MHPGSASLPGDLQSQEVMNDINGVNEMEKQRSKKELDELISETYTLGDYYFDEEKQCFFGNMEILLAIREIEKDKYKACEYYYCGGYECSLSEEEQNQLVFSGSRDEVRQLCFDQASPSDQFMGYPVIETNVSLSFEMLDKTLYIYRADGTVETSTY